MHQLPKLQQLHLEIDTRVGRIREQHADWLCGKGCDNCCRRLAEVPQLTATEWGLLREGLNTLAPAQLEEISQKMAALAGQTTRPLTCPLLDQATGACPVYAQRPVACRTYGFYVQRELGLYCHDIESAVAKSELADIVWGNHDHIDLRLSDFGERRPLTAWFAAGKPLLG